MIEFDKKKKENAILVGVSQNNDRWITEDHLDELEMLADTAGAAVVKRIIQEKNRIDPAYFIGRGKAEELARQVTEQKAGLVIFDDDLSPAQMRNLEKMVDKKILDRSGLILDIFATRAKTKEAKTQVELAQLNYLLPRLTRQWTHLSRQVGGIGTRGPGETQLEVDRRLIRKRISVLKQALEKIKNQREVRRRARKDVIKVALVGYTNAGKSTLLNALTESDVFVEDRLFATLDPTVRRLHLPGLPDALLIDTVGFIRKLPHNLVASFMSTLEEAADADILLHVSDVSHPMLFEHIAIVKDVLKELNIAEKPTLFVFNKLDKLDSKAIVDRLSSEYEKAVFVSARRGLFLQDLTLAVADEIKSSTHELHLKVDIKHSDTISKIYDLAEVLLADYTDTEVEMHVKIDNEHRALLERLLSKNGAAAKELKET